MNVIDFLQEAHDRGIYFQLSEDKTGLRCKSKNPVSSQFIEKARAWKPLIVNVLKARRNYHAWGCAQCPQMEKEAGTCVLEFTEGTFVIPVCHLKNCPRRSKEILDAIRREDYSAWLDREISIAPNNPNELSLKYELS